MRVHFLSIPLCVGGLAAPAKGGERRRQRRRKAAAAAAAAKCGGGGEMAIASDEIRRVSSSLRVELGTVTTCRERQDCFSFLLPAAAPLPRRCDRQVPELPPTWCVTCRTRTTPPASMSCSLARGLLAPGQAAQRARFHSQSVF